MPESAIQIEDQSTNFGENVRFTKIKNPNLVSAVFVTKPNAVLRLGLVIKKIWPAITAVVDSPIIRFPSGVSNIVGILGFIDEMVGDIQRIKNYPILGFQEACEIPKETLDDYQTLIDGGFVSHMLPK